MKTKKILFFVVSVLFFYSCFKDKGNYDYIPVTTVDFLTHFNSSAISRTGYLGQTYKLYPKGTYSNEPDSVNFRFWWELVGDFAGNLDSVIVICEEKELNFIPDRTGYVNYRLCAEHVPTGVIYTQGIQLQIVSPFGKGWAILSEMDNRSSVSFILPGYNGATGVPANRTYLEYKDFYHSMYENDPLGTGPIALRQMVNNISAVVVLQESGTVSVNGETFEKELTLDEEFVGQQYPANFNAIDFFYGARVDAVLSANGDVYTRDYNRSQGEYQSVFHVTFFSPYPLEFEGVKMHVDKIIPVMFSSCSFYGFADNDEANGHGRIWWIGNGGNYYDGRMRRTIIPETEEVPEDAVDLNDFNGYQLLVAGGGYVNSSSVFTLFKKDNTLKAQIFKLTGSFIDQLTVTSISVRDVSDILQITDDTRYYIARTTENLFYATGNKVYLYKMASGTQALLYTFEPGDKITAISSNPQESELGVGFENGKIVFLDIKTNLDDVKPLTQQTFTGYGKIVDVMYKFSNFVGYTFGTSYPD